MLKERKETLKKISFSKKIVFFCKYSFDLASIIFLDFVICIIFQKYFNIFYITILENCGNQHLNLIKHVNLC